MSTTAVAQGGDNNSGAPTPSGTTMQINLGGQVMILKPVDPAQASRVKLDPASIVVDAKTSTAVVRLTNNKDDTAHVTVTVRDPVILGATAPGGNGNDTTAAHVRSLASWVQDLPKDVTLAPHETRTVTLHLKVPAKLADGDYLTYVLADGHGVKLIYHAQAK